MRSLLALVLFAVLGHAMALSAFVADPRLVSGAVAIYALGLGVMLAVAVLLAGPRPRGGRP
jgi:hypothetical protein